MAGYNCQYAMTSVEKGPRRVGMHSHGCFELVYYFEGSGVLTIAGEDIPRTPSMVALAYPDSPHDDDCYGTTKVIYMGFSCDSIPLNEGMYKANGHIESLFLQIMQEQIRQQPYYRDQMSVLLEQIIIELLRFNSSENQKQITNLDFIPAFFEENYFNPINMEALAKNCHYSAGRFRQLIRERFGESPKQLLTRIRIEHAQKLLRDTTMSVADIAAATGFYDSAQFNRIFVKQCGITPLQYRKNP